MGLLKVLVVFALNISFANCFASSATVDTDHLLWMFAPSNSDLSFPVKIGDNLFWKLKGKATCCSGTYLTTIDIQKLNNLSESDKSNFGILLPGTSGLKSVEINGRELKLPDYDYSNSGTVIPISVDDIRSRKLDVKVKIDHQSIYFTGMWRGQFLIDQTQILERKRDLFYVSQTLVALFFAITLLLFSIIFIWIVKQKKINSPIYKEYLFGYLSAVISMLFMSGITRVAS